MVNLRKISILSKGLVWWFDYLIWLFFSPFKFKRFPRRVNKILVVEQIGIGDLIVTIPVIRALKEKFKCKIDVLVSDGFEDVLYGNRDINEVFSFSSNEIKRNFRRVVSILKKRKYDLAVLLHPDRNVGNYKISKLLFKSVPFRVGCTRVGFLEGKGFFMNRKTRPSIGLKHKIEDNLDVIKSIEVFCNNKSLKLFVDSNIDREVKSKLKGKYIVIHAKPAHRTHEWFKDRFAELADRIIERYKIKVVFTGSEKDFVYNQEIISIMKNDAYIFIGSIKEFFSVIKNASFVISVDTSAMHVAAGFDRKVIALFGAGNPLIWRPYCKNCFVVFNKNKCVSCMKHKCKFKGKRYMECMKAIKVIDIISILERFK
jgi:heptosyltransferase-2